MTCFMVQNNLLGLADGRQKRCDEFRFSQFTNGHMQTCISTPLKLSLITKIAPYITFSKIIHVFSFVPDD
jgi:hypothetical protein